MCKVAKLFLIKNRKEKVERIRMVPTVFLNTNEVYLKTNQVHGAALA